MLLLFTVESSKVFRIIEHPLFFFYLMGGIVKKRSLKNLESQPPRVLTTDHGLIKNEILALGNREGGEGRGGGG